MKENPFIEDLKFKVEQLNTGPGVYLMRNKQKDIIYIGKAVNLRNRVRSYFRYLYQKEGLDYLHQNTDIKSEYLIRNIHDFETIITDSENEALVLESVLIKQHKPRFNVRLKDDKRYPYIRVTLSEEFPRIYITRKLPSEKSRDKVFGPYTDVRYVRRLLENIFRLFKIRSCKLDLPRQKLERPCLEYDMGRCDAPCVDKIDRKRYNEIVQSLILFLEGKVDDVRDYIQKKIEEYSEQWDYERAAQMRDILKGIEVIHQSQKVDFREKLDSDIISYYREGSECCLVRFKLRNGNLVDRSHFIFTGAEGDLASDFMDAFFREVYINSSDQNFPPYIFVKEKPLDRELYANFLTSKIGQAVTIFTLKEISEDSAFTGQVAESNHSYVKDHARNIPTGRSGDWEGLLNLAERNARLIYEEERNRRDFQDKRKALLEIQKKMQLPAPPELIECFDISNIQGSYNIASLVCFQNGQPNKSRYRRFRIRSVQGKADDFQSMHEAVARHLTRLNAEERPFPDLILIDGGKGQLNAAVQAANDLDLTQRLHFAGIAKREEEIFLPGMSESLNWSNISKGLLLLRRIRDETHRFGITYHRLWRNKSELRSRLDDVEGLGAALRSRIIRAVVSSGSELDDLASVNENFLRNIPGIGPQLLERILLHLQSVTPESKN